MTGISQLHLPLKHLMIFESVKKPIQSILAVLDLIYILINLLIRSFSNIPWQHRSLHF